LGQSPDFIRRTCPESHHEVAPPPRPPLEGSIRRLSKQGFHPWTPLGSVTLARQS